MVFTSIDLSLAPSNQTNILDNGGFEVWQRGTSFSTPANQSYTADRWKLSNGGGSTFVISQNSSVVDSGQYSLSVNITVGSSNSFQLYQIIENYQAYLGKTVTLSMRVWSNTAGPVIALSDNLTNTFSSAHPGDSEWHTLTVTKTLSSSMTSFQAFFQVALTEQTVVSQTYWDSAMLVTGANAGTFVPLHPAIDLARCQRYYEAQHFPETVVPVLRPSAGGGNAIWQFVPFQVQKRVAPTITSTLVSVVISALGGQTGSDSSDTGAWSLSGSAQSFVGGASVELTRATDGGLPSALIEFTWTASADL